MKIRRKPSEEYVRSRAPLWFDLAVARRVQRRIAESVVVEDPPVVKYVAGIDVAYRGDVAYAVAVLYDKDSKRLIDWACDVSRVHFPYIPTLLAFRELTPMVRALLKLRIRPHLVFVDGQGIAHPFKAGIATHLGVVLNVASVGVAKSLLYGVVYNEGEGPVLDPDTHQVIGWTVRCSSRVLYVSIGNKVTLNTSVALVREFCVNSTSPLPIREAHARANEVKKRGRCL